MLRGKQWLVTVTHNVHDQIASFPNPSLQLTFHDAIGFAPLRSDFEIARDPRIACEWKSFITDHGDDHEISRGHVEAGHSRRILSFLPTALFNSDVFPTAALLTKGPALPAGKSMADIQAVCNATTFPTLTADPGPYFLIPHFVLIAHLGAATTVAPVCSHSSIRDASSHSSLNFPFLVARDIPFLTSVVPPMFARRHHPVFHLVAFVKTAIVPTFSLRGARDVEQLHLVGLTFYHFLLLFRIAILARTLMDAMSSDLTNN
ncbi:hypothetical protein B0H19DRAFT_1274180 [Mycena capillaripes]|nr:hypothetical protein B0H19DRAFT_1274180 [Mycena capillaripes]